MVVAPAVWVPHIFLGVMTLGSAQGAVDLAGRDADVAADRRGRELPDRDRSPADLFPATVANRILARGEAAERSAGLQEEFHSLEEVAFAILGLYFMAMAMFDATYWYSKLSLYPRLFAVMRLDEATIPDRDFAGIVETGVQFIAGLALLLAGPGLAGVMRRLRGRRAKADETRPGRNEGRSPRGIRPCGSERKWRPDRRRAQPAPVMPRRTPRSRSAAARSPGPWRRRPGRRTRSPPGGHCRRTGSPP